MRALESFFFLLENVHHRKEEELLFPLLFGRQSLEVGGPKCMTFFTPRVLGAGCSDGFRPLAEKLGFERNESSLNDFRKSVFGTNSMLKIPVEDHLLGARATHELLACLRLDPPNLREAAELFLGFERFLRGHIQREEECLFRLFQRELSAAELGQFQRDAAALDRDLGTEGLLAELEKSAG